MKHLRRVTAILLAAVMCLTVLGACAPDSGETTAATTAQEKGVPQINGGKPVTIIVNLGEYAPSDNEVPTQDAPDVFYSTRVLIAKFRELHPNVTVVLDKTSPTTGGDYVASLNQWMLPRLAAGTQMDIACNLGGAELFGDSDWFIDLSDMLETPNAYIPEGQPGHDRWADQWPTYLWSSNVVKNTKSEIVAIPYMLDCGSPTAYFYNKEIFAELNLEIPKNKIVVFTGVSGSGKSSIVFDTIAAESQRQMNETYSAWVRGRLPKYEKPNVEFIDKLNPSVIIDQSRLGGNSRSTVGTISDMSGLELPCSHFDTD